MKGLAHMYVWWPGITADIEDTVRGCTECQMNQSTSPAAPLHPWSWPTWPWEGYIWTMLALLKVEYSLTDAHSKWMKLSAHQLLHQKQL